MTARASPPTVQVMGWSTWNAFHRHFTEETFYETADLMAANGMQAAGYEYINVRAMMPL